MAREAPPVRIPAHHRRFASQANWLGGDLLRAKRGSISGDKPDCLEHSTHGGCGALGPSCHQGCEACDTASVCCFDHPEDLLAPQITDRLHRMAAGYFG